MTDFSLENFWERVEQQFQQVSIALATADVTSLVEHSAGLQQLSVELVNYLDSGASAGVLVSDVRERILGLSSRMPALREVLHRRNAHVELALQTLVPTAPLATTYAAEGTKAGTTVYGTIPRKSGTFQVTAA
jgi:hypothetical protein